MIESYLKTHEEKELCRFITCGSVDDGKSTLIGRLLYDTKSLFSDQIATLQKDSRKNAEGNLDFALLVDGLSSEREQGITIDVAYRFFTSNRRKFIIADTPGHEQYTRNMATGASTADIAIILIDARKGVLTQTKRHSYIVSLLGIRHIIVAINKMDLVSYDEEVFNKICRDYKEILPFLHNDIKTYFIPICALSGENVVKTEVFNLNYDDLKHSVDEYEKVMLSEKIYFQNKDSSATPQNDTFNVMLSGSETSCENKTPLESTQTKDSSYSFRMTQNLNSTQNTKNLLWYKGKSLLELLDTIELDSDRDNEFIMPTQLVNRPHLNFRAFCGTIASGNISLNDEIIALPSMQKARVKSIITSDIKDLRALGKDEIAESQNLAKSGMSSRIHFLSGVSDEELALLYNAATASFTPSMYEGFGLPLLEAMACGTPVVTCRNSSLGEIGGDAVVYLEEPIERALVQVMEQFEQHQFDTKSFREKGLERADMFTWENTALQTCQLYGKCLYSQ